jgi:hypothetical protein
MKEYDITITALIELNAKFAVFGKQGSEDAIANAMRELRTHGELRDIQVDRCIFLDSEPEQE